jgi:hypothetical protein
MFETVKIIFIKKRRCTIEKIVFSQIEVGSGKSATLHKVFTNLENTPDLPFFTRKKKD